MASENPAAPPPREAVEHQDQSIKVRKSQLFEPTEHANGAVIKPFPEYLKTTPPAPLPRGIQVALWTATVLVVLLFLAAMVLGRGAGPRGRRVERVGPRAGILVAANLGQPTRV